MKAERAKETDIAAFFEGRLSGERRQEIEAFLAKDPCLIDELLALYRTGHSSAGPEAGPVPEGLLRHVISLSPSDKGLFDVVLGLIGNTIRVLISDSGTDISRPQVSYALRSNGSQEPEVVVIRKSFDEFDLELDVQRSRGGLCTIIVDVPAARNVRSDHLRAELLSEGRIIASEHLAGGRSVFEELGPGRYSVIIRKNGKVFGSITLKIKEMSGEGNHD
ncbi:MAG: hypothetical protein EPN25_13915 [Nitrospirae bacterium]|nr:MAG: hypothetical protein EPN25_13915 [Nitrospirota bacterium]